MVRDMVGDGSSPVSTTWSALLGRDSLDVGETDRQEHVAEDAVDV